MTAAHRDEGPDLVQTSLAARGGLAVDDPAYPGQADYTVRFLTHVYDPLVLGFANRFVWRCPTSHIIDLYDRHVAAAHLDIGPGTGHLLDRCRFPTAAPSITLLDLNADVLAVARHTIRRHRPVTYQANLLEPLDLPPGSFGSIGMTHVLHCLPGGMAGKGLVLDRLRPLLCTGGRLFGTTVLGAGAGHSAWSRRWLAGLNHRGVLNNRDDDEAGLRAALQRNFTEFDLRVRGRVAVFAGFA